jgi:RNA polymerase sigma-70 factor (ECF subfamily)
VTESQLQADRALARRVADGDSDAFEDFFREYFPRLFRFTLSRVDANADMAEEVVQQTMCRVVQKMDSYRGEALLFTWLCMICRNEIATLYRSRGMQQSKTVFLEDHPAIRAALESISVEEDSLESEQNEQELARFVRLTLEYLPAKYATALEMKYIGGCSVDEIGAKLQISTKAAESLLTRARSAFKEGFNSLWDFEPGHLLD